MADSRCTVRDCPEQVHCKGMCRPHYMRNYHYGDPLAGGPFGRYVAATPENYEQRIDRSGPMIPGRPDMGHCWLWLGRLDNGGYGVFASGRRTKTLRVHRKSWEDATGRSAEGLELDHLCHSLDLSCAGGKCIHRRCLSPRHLEPVGHRENQLRGVRGRRMTHCKRGHELESIGVRRGYERRQCLVCRDTDYRALQAVAAENRSAAGDMLTATPEVLAELARVYLNAQAHGGAPRAAVVRHFGRPPNTVSDWIRKARDAGLLPPVPLRPDDGRRRVA